MKNILFKIYKSDVLGYDDCFLEKYNPINFYFIKQIFSIILMSLLIFLQNLYAQVLSGNENLYLQGSNYPRTFMGEKPVLFDSNDHNTRLYC